jgi:site-specific DNA-methyltransferase (adenine-specific)
MDDRYRLFCGDNLQVLRRWRKEFVDAVVCDPPAGINFMGKKWDHDKHHPEKWIEWLAERLEASYRVLKPGGHILVWALPRTSHRTALAMERAGFVIRDRHSHFFGTGFPKGGGANAISKQIDKSMGVEPTIVGENPNHRPGSGTEYEGTYAGGNTGSKHLTAPTSPEAKEWEGWSTALKPACEDWWLAWKPFKGPIYKNVLKHGTGGLNIDVNRIPTEDKLTRKLGKSTESDSGWKSINRSEVAGKDGGRWPAHISFDEEINATLPEEAQRFFYTAKPNPKEKAFGLDKGEKNDHPTVKSQSLMRWLVRMITPPGGVVLDPFMGSGSTGMACMTEGFRFVGIDQDEHYVEMAGKRIDAALQEVR